MPRYLSLLLVSTLLVAMQTVSSGYTVTINSINYPEKVHPNEKFSVSALVVSNDVNGWASIKLYLNDQELKTSSGVWYGWVGTDAGKNTTITLSDVTLGPSVIPYNLQIVAFWKPVNQGEIKQAAMSFKITVVSLILTADCLPNSVNASENFMLDCIITNTGNDVAYGVSVAVSNYADFSPKGELHQDIGDLKAGQSKPISFNMSSPIVIYPSSHDLTLRITYRDFSDTETSTTQHLSIKVDLTPGTALEGALTIAPWLILAVVVLVILFYAFVGRRLRVSKGGVTIYK